jgi:hypothetical protein
VADLNDEEQEHVRVALRFLHSRARGWGPLGAVLGFKRRTLESANQGRLVSATLAFRVARFAAVTLEDLLTGKYPPVGTCPHCGHATDAVQSK